MSNSFDTLCASIKIRRLSKSFLDSRAKAFESSIAKYARQGEEDDANRVWVLKTLFEVQNYYLKAFSLIKKKKYYQAWCDLEHCEVTLLFLLPHYKPTDEDKYLIDFINQKAQSWQSIFPYKMFLSPEILEKKIQCNICGKILSAFSRCNHKVGELYNGIMCIRNIVDLEFLGVSLPIFVTIYIKPHR